MRAWKQSQTHLFIFLGVLSCFTACSSTSKNSLLTDAELIQNLPRESRDKILNLALRDYRRPQDTDIDAYLSGIAARVTHKKELATKNKIQAVVISSHEASDAVRIWPLPPDRLLFDDRVLKALDFENEIAAAIAFSWELTQDSSFQQRFLAEVDLSEPNLKAIYKFSEAEEMKAVETSIDLLYTSRYDPRGLVTYFDKLKNLNRHEDTEGDELLTRLQDKARRTIAYYPPLMNPTIRTQEFYRIRKRLERL